MNRLIRSAAVLVPLLSMSLGCSGGEPTPPPPHVWTVHGIVTDAVTGMPIEGATASLFAGTAGEPVTTDATGFFSFADVGQGTDVIVTLSAAGYVTAVVHASTKYFTDADGGLVPADLIDASAALQPVPPPAPTWTVQGVVVDVATGAPLAGVAVSLSNGVSATPEAATTGANGVYTIAGVTSVDDLIVQFSKSGYTPASVHVTGPFAATVVNVSAQLAPIPPAPVTVGLAVQGWVYAGAAPAADATVWLWSNEGLSYVSSAQTDSAGKFAFSGVKSGSYELRVLPFDKDGNGVSDFRLHCFELGQIDRCISDATGGSTDNTTVGLACSSSVNLSNLVIQLEEKSHDIAGGSFVRLSTVSPSSPTGYPISAADLAAGVTGVLQDGTRPIFLHFGSEVDASTADVQLFAVDFAKPNAGTPVPATLTWLSDVILTVTPAGPLGADSDHFSQLLVAVRDAPGWRRDVPRPARGQVCEIRGADLAGPEPSRSRAQESSSRATVEGRDR